MRFDPTNPHKIIVIPVTAPPKRRKREQVIPPEPVKVHRVETSAKAGSIDLNSVIFEKPLVTKPAQAPNLIRFPTSPIPRTAPPWRR